MSSDIDNEALFTNYPKFKEYIGLYVGSIKYTKITWRTQQASSQYI